jgi:hypothetical protein
VVIPGGRRLVVEHRLTFGDVGVGAPMILRDDDGRPELAINHGSFATSYGGKVGDDVVVDPAGRRVRVGHELDNCALPDGYRIELIERA